MFVTNPIDALFLVHEAIRAIQRAGRRQNGEDVGKEQLMPFDGMFSLLIGVVLASDVPDFFQFSEFLEKFVPKDGLSNPFEYARVGMEALMFHYRTVLTRIS
jgi:hypothetical protein